MSFFGPFALSPTNNEANFLVAEGDKAKLALIKRKKRDFDYMTSSVLLEHQKHLLASLQFKAIYNRILFVPSIGITLVSGILAILAQSGLYSEHTSSWFTVWIAILAAFSVFWQSLMKQLDYGGRAKLHDSTASALNKIFKLARMRAREQKIGDLDDAFNKHSNSKRGSEQVSDELQQDVEVGVPVASGPTELAVDGTRPDQDANITPEKTDMQVIGAGEDHFTLSKQFQQALEGCTSVVPIRITTAFDALDSRINVSNKRLMPSECAKPKIAWEKVYPALYHQLTLTIIGSKLWPYMAPEAEWAVEKTIKDFQTMDACLLEVLVERTHAIDRQYNSLASKNDTTRTLAINVSPETTPLLSADGGERI